MGREPVAKRNILNSWFECKEANHGLSRADCIRMLNEQFGTRYTNTDVYRWIGSIKPVPDRILQVINDDIEELVCYILEKHGVKLSESQISNLSADFEIPAPKK